MVDSLGVDAVGNRSLRDEKQGGHRVQMTQEYGFQRAPGTRAGAPGRGDLKGKKPFPDTPEPAPPVDSPTKDLSVAGAARKIKSRKQQIDEASDY